MNFQEELFALQDVAYADFRQNLRREFQGRPLLGLEFPQPENLPRSLSESLKRQHF